MPRHSSFQLNYASSGYLMICQQAVPINSVCCVIALESTKAEYFLFISSLFQRVYYATNNIIIVFFSVVIVLLVLLISNTSNQVKAN